MTESLLPKLRKINVSPDKLVLDPNNPRLITSSDQYVPEGRCMDPGVIEDTGRKMLPDGDRFHIREIESSIRANGWQPIDFIFVKAVGSGGQYVVLEGNRRVTAVRNLLRDDELSRDLRRSLLSIEVMEVLPSGPGGEEQLRRQVSYLLGVRHHGSLHKWRPFAQAQNIFLRYLDSTNATADSFRWSSEVGARIASALSVAPKDVEERVRVYRVMVQLDGIPAVKSSEARGGGIKDRYYSLVSDGLTTKNKALRRFIHQDPETFLLDEESLERMQKLCLFENPDRVNAPLVDPQEWRPLTKILEDEDPQKRTDNVQAVLEGRRPSDVWALRAEELRKLQWDKWLIKIYAVMQGVELGTDFDAEAKGAIVRLGEVINALDGRDAK